MIAGIVRDEIEMIVPLELFDAQGTPNVIHFVLDSGFTGYLALSPSNVRDLGLAPKGLQSGFLADGTAVAMRLVEVHVNWHGTAQKVDAQILGEPLIGTRMLKGSELRAKFEPSGEVTINELVTKSP